MFKGNHEARAALNAALRAGQIKLAAPSLNIFRLLLDHAWYTEDRYGYVNDSNPKDSHYGIRGNDDIATLTGYSERTVREHLKLLVEARLIHCQPRPIGTGGKHPDLIAITWATFHAEDEAEPAAPSASGQIEHGAEPAALSTEPAALSTEPEAPAGSFLYKNQEDARRRAATSTPSGDRAKDDTRAIDGPLAEVPTWDGDIDRLIIPARYGPGIQEYLVSANGQCRPVRGTPRDGEVRAKLNFDEISHDRMTRQGHTRAIASAN